MKMIVVPIVSVSIICGISQLDGFSALGRIGLKTLFLYLLTTALAITIAMFFAELFHIGHGLSLMQKILKVLEKNFNLKN